MANPEDNTIRVAAAITQKLAEQEPGPDGKKASSKTSLGSLVQEISAVVAGATTPEKQISGAPGGLAARRRMMGGLSMSINTKGEKNMEKGEKVPSKRNSIKKCGPSTQFVDFYTMGAEVMPSTNTGMDVLFAKRKKDGM